MTPLMDGARTLLAFFLHIIPGLSNNYLYIMSINKRFFFYSGIAVKKWTYIEGRKEDRLWKTIRVLG